MPNTNERDAQPWRVGLYWSSSNPEKQVLCLSVGEKAISRDGNHKDFIRWESATTPNAGAPLPLTEEQREDVLDALRNTHGLAGDVEEMLDAVLEEVAAVGAPLPLAPSDALDEGCVRKALSNALMKCDLTNADRTAIFDQFIPRWKVLATPPRATLPASEPVAWMDPAQPRDPIGAEKKRDLETINGAPGRVLAEKFTVPLYSRAQPQADAAEPVLQAAGAIARYFEAYETIRGEAAGDSFTDPFTKKKQVNQVSVPVPLLRALCASLAAQAPGARGEQA